MNKNEARRGCLLPIEGDRRRTATPTQMADSEETERWRATEVRPANLFRHDFGKRKRVDRKRSDWEKLRQTCTTERNKIGEVVAIRIENPQARKQRASRLLRGAEKAMA